MLKKIILIVLMMSLIAVIFAQQNEDINYDRKSARKAMILSSLFPGAGQYYADKTSFTTYVFPILEIGLWVGYLYYHNQGIETERDYEDFANGEVIGYRGTDCPDINPDTLEPYYVTGDPVYRYNREYQEYSQNDIIYDTGHFDNGFYDNHFRLDDTNTQHFFEDIGKYNKYLFGWSDWFDIYATDGNGNFESPNWYWVADTSDVYKVDGLLGPNNLDSEYYLGNEAAYDDENGVYSGYRQQYIEMRKEAEEYYNKGRNFSYGIIANHVLAAMDAIRLSKKHNKQYAKTRLQFQVAPIFINNQLSAAFSISKRF